jgi:hypothetical protein
MSEFYVEFYGSPNVTYIHARVKKKKQQSDELHLKTCTMNLAYILRLPSNI